MNKTIIPKVYAKFRDGYNEIFIGKEIAISYCNSRNIIIDKVVKIGRELFYTEKKYAIYIANTEVKSNYSSHYTVYSSENAFNYIVERNKTKSKIIAEISARIDFFNDHELLSINHVINSHKERIKNENTNS